MEDGRGPLSVRSKAPDCGPGGPQSSATEEERRGLTGRGRQGGMLTLPRDSREEPSSPDPRFPSPRVPCAKMRLGTALNARSGWSVVLGLGPPA